MACLWPRRLADMPEYARELRSVVQAQGRESTMERFYWIREFQLAGSSRPGGRWDEQLPADLDELQSYGIGAIVSLTEMPLDEFAIQELGIYLHAHSHHRHDRSEPDPDVRRAGCDRSGAWGGSGSRGALPGWAGAYRHDFGRVVDPARIDDGRCSCGDSRGVPAGGRERCADCVFTDVRTRSGVGGVMQVQRRSG